MGKMQYTNEEQRERGMWEGQKGKIVQEKIQNKRGEGNGDRGIR
jgi:hypothetical protein